MTDELLALLDAHDLELADFTAADRDFLRALVEEEEATTSAIRSYGLKRKQIHYRYDSLADDGLIEVDKVGLENHDGRKQNAATLTDLGEQLVDAGLVEEVTDPNTNLEEMNRRIDRAVDSLTGEVNAAVKDLNQDYRQTHHRVSNFEARLDKIENRLGRIENALQTTPSTDD